jgi:hypothetical protein
MLEQRLNRYDQWNTVLQGLALGCLALRTDRLPATRAKIEPAIVKAWRVWPWADEFPAVFAREFDVFAMRSSRRNTEFASWEWGRTWMPRATNKRRDIDETLIAFAERGRVTADGWLQLAEHFTAELPPP